MDSNKNDDAVKIYVPKTSQEPQQSRINQESDEVRIYNRAAPEAQRRLSYND